MFLKPFGESDELKLWQSLHYRMDLSAKDTSYYWTLEKGYIGEGIFHEWLLGLSDNCLILHDILLEVNSSLFQIDFILISGRTIYLFEVKNYEGDSYIESDHWYSLPSKAEIKNPLHQIQRSEPLFRRFLQNLGYNVSVESYVVFVNPHFTLYQAPLVKPLILPTQLSTFFDQLNRQISSSSINGKHEKIGQQIISAHKHVSPISRLPEYSYGQLKKGIICAECGGFIAVFEGKNLKCRKCNFSEDVETAVLRCVEELVLLFPNMKITTSGILEWCVNINDIRTIRRIMLKKYKLINKGRSSYFE
jgi:hypothetical protein